MSPVISLTVEAGLQAEQELLASICAGDAEFGLLFWQPNDRALVMPRRLSRLPGFAHACEVSAAHGWPVLLRETGGEPVPQSGATVNIALVYAPPRSEGDHGRIETGYRRLCDPICQLLDELGGVASLGEVQGAFVTGASTSTSTAGKWWVPLSAGVRARAVNGRWAWSMARFAAERARVHGRGSQSLQ